MSSPEGFPVEGFLLRLRPSPSRLTGLGLVIVAGLPGLWSGGFEPAMALALSLALMLSCSPWLVSQLPWLSANAIVAINYGETSWHLERCNGKFDAAEFLGASHIGRRLIVLNFRCADGSRVAVALSADAVQADLFRRLRVMLRLGALPLSKSN